MRSPAAGIHWIRHIVLVWLGWAVLMLGFQSWVQARYELKRPDMVKDWTASWTNAGSGARHLYLQSPVMKGHAAWDSEFYISIALHGYEDPTMRAASPASTPEAEVAGAKGAHPNWVSLNHAFFPGYPFAMALIARPLAAIGVEPIGAATLAGVIVSLIAALFAMIAIADLARADSLPDEDAPGNALRSGFYLVVWPAAVFLAQVYSESLFLAFSFGALAAMKRQRWGWAAALAVGAVWTRATGVLLIVPLGLAWLSDREQRTIPRALLAAAPLIAYLAWRLVFGRDFDFVETRYFGRWPFALGHSLDAWGDFLGTLTGGETQTRAYDLIELAGILAALVTSALLWRRDRGLALYGLATFAVVATSGAALGMHRYALAMPAMFMAPAYVGARHPVFDRLWTLACALGLAALALAFSFGFWAG